MIAKISNGSSLFGAVTYNQQKIDKGEAKVIYRNNMIENVSGNNDLDFHYTLKSFEPYLLANQRTEKPVIHISLNPDPKDRLSDKEYAQLAHDYMEKMGFGDQLYIVYKHEDIDRRHLHIATVRVDEHGKKLSDSYEKLRSMDACRELEIQYGLIPALKKERELGQNFIKKIDYECGDIKRQISNTVKSLLQGYKFQSMGEYSALLSCYHIDVKHVKGIKLDREYNGIVYASKNEKGDIVSNPFKSSLFGKSFGYEGLAKLMKKSAETLKAKDLSIRSKTIVSEAMRTAKTRNDFEKALQSKGMNVVFRENDQGRIYGVTFIDHENRVVLNGSRLGKDFSANVFHQWFNEGEKKIPAFEGSASKSEYFQQEDIQENQSTGIGAGTSQDNSSIEEMLGVFELKPHGEDSEGKDFVRKMRKKKRKHM